MAFAEDSSNNRRRIEESFKVIRTEAFSGVILSSLDSVPASIGD